MINPVIRNLSFEQGTERVVIGDTSYDFNVQLVNSDLKNVGIKFSSIVEFVITDDLTNFYPVGYIIFKNFLDALESANSISTDVRGMEETAFNNYQFRGDGRDFLAVNIAPAVAPDDHDTKIRTSSSQKKQFELNHLFSIYDTEDILIESQKNVKLKKLYLHDFSYHFLNEKNIYFSTANLVKKQQSVSTTATSTKRLISNEERSVETGEAIREIINKTFTEDFNTPQTFDSNWDVGSSKIFYSSPANNKAIDDLYYLLDYHVSTPDNDYCPSILRKDRDNKWSLVPVKKIFETAYNNSQNNFGGQNMVENFIIVRPNAGDEPKLNRPDRSSFSLFANNFTDYSYAENFEQSNMSTTAHTFGIVSHAVHNYNPATKTFSVDTQDNNITQSLNRYKSIAVQKNKGIGGSAPVSNFPSNFLTKQNLNLIHTYNPNPDQRSRINSGQNKILLNSIFNNNAIAFKTRGNTIRQAGKFVSFDRKNLQNDSSFDNKLLGTYLVVRVDHVFSTGTYYNNLVCTKTYDSQQSDISSNVL